MDLENKEGVIVLGTEDMSKVALGFCTYNANYIGVYNVNIGVSETLVKEHEYKNIENALLDIYLLFIL